MRPAYLEVSHDPAHRILPAAVWRAVSALLSRMPSSLAEHVSALYSVPLGKSVTLLERRGNSECGATLLRNLPHLVEPGNHLRMANKPAIVRSKNHFGRCHAEALAQRVSRDTGEISTQSRGKTHSSAINGSRRDRPRRRSTRLIRAAIILGTTGGCFRSSAAVRCSWKQGFE